MYNLYTFIFDNHLLKENEQIIFLSTNVCWLTRPKGLLKYCHDFAVCHPLCVHGDVVVINMSHFNNLRQCVSSFFSFLTRNRNIVSNL